MKDRTKNNGAGKLVRLILTDIPYVREAWERKWKGRRKMGVG